MKYLNEELHSISAYVKGNLKYLSSVQFGYHKSAEYVVARCTLRLHSVQNVNVENNTKKDSFSLFDILQSFWEFSMMYIPCVS